MKTMANSYLSILSMEKLELKEQRHIFVPLKTNLKKSIKRWITVNSRDDLFRIGFVIDFNKLGYRLLLFNDDSYDEA